MSATSPRSTGGKRKSKSKMKLEMNLEELSEYELASGSGTTTSSRGSSKSADALPEMPGPEWKHEPVLRNALHTLLQETSHDEDAFAVLREICQETLNHRHRALARNGMEIRSADGNTSGVSPGTQRSRMISMASGSGAASENDESAVAGKATLVPPKSPQERLMALVPNAIEKGKRSYQRRASPNVHTEEPSRWKKIDDDQVPLTDLTVIFTGDTVPDGFTKLERSPSGLRADLNKGGRGAFVYLCQSKDQSANKLPIGEVIAIFPERGEFVPTDYEVVQRRGVPANLNTGTQGEKIYLCYKRSVTSSIVDVMVLFPKKGEKLPYDYMKVDKTPDGHLADINMNSGGTELHSLRELHAKWLQATLPAHDGQSSSVHRAEPPVQTKHKMVGFHSTPRAKPSPPATTSRPASGLKSAELREIAPASPLRLPPASPSERKAETTFSWKEALEYYMYPLLFACYTRHGAAADAALQGLSQCLDAGLFDETAVFSDACRLEVVVDAVASICHQGVKSRFALALPFFRKVIRKCPNGFNPGVLHATLKSIIFIGDFDSSLVKSVEDELVYKIMTRYEAVHCERALAINKLTRVPAPQTSDEIARELVTHLIDDVSTGVEIAKTTEQMLGIFKVRKHLRFSAQAQLESHSPHVSASHSSIHSPTFCTDLVATIDVFVESHAERNALQLIVTLSKAVHRRAANAGEHGHARDHLSIINSLRALNVALLAAGTHTKEHRIFGQIIRRFVFSTVNSITLIWSTDVFRASLTLVSTLWNHYRRHLKVELALLFEHLFLRILRSNAACAVHHQMDIMHELTPWMQLPHNVVEIFLNFDMDRIQQWKIFEHFCSALCSIAEGISTHSTGTEDTDDSSLHLQTQAINTILAIARSVMDASGHAHLISRDARTRHLSMENGGWEQDEAGDELFAAGASALNEPIVREAHDNPNSPQSQPSSPVSAKDAPNRSINGSRGTKFGSISVRMRNELQKRNQQHLKRAMEIASSKSLKKAIEYLVAMNFVKDSPRDVTSFLRLYHDFFDEAEIGDYLGEGDEDFKVQVRLSYVRAISFKGMTLVESLRHFLTNGGFRLPGEAQKIERMVEAFAQCYWEDSPASFSSADTAMIIAYSIIMLNTDLHNPQVKKNKMSKDQFVKNNRGIDNGKDLPKRFLEEIYDDIAHHPMHIKGTRFLPKAREANSSLLDLDTDKFRGSLSKSVAQFDELLKDLSQSYYTFHFVGVDTCISPDLIKILFERVWFYLLALSTSILCDTQSDLSMTTHCLDLLRFCISTCLFLGMSIERQAFCNLLAKVQSALDESKIGDNEDDEEMSSAGQGTAAARESQAWTENIETAAATDDPWAVMGDIHLLVNKMKDAIQRQQKSEELNSVIKRINRSHAYLKDTTQFLREGDLTKKCRSRNQVYRFFLFNDQLLYADKNMSGYWNPHNSLRLKLTRITDIADSVMHKHAFQIINPVKSFVVYAESAHSKADWMRLIEDAITETAKKINRNARRLSTQERARPVEAATGLASSPTSSSMVASASTAMKVLMRRSSRVSSPTSDRDPSGRSVHEAAGDHTAASPSPESLPASHASTEEGTSNDSMVNQGCAPQIRVCESSSSVISVSERGTREGSSESIGNAFNGDGGSLIGQCPDEHELEPQHTSRMQAVASLTDNAEEASSLLLSNAVTEPAPADAADVDDGEEESGMRCGIESAATIELTIENGEQEALLVAVQEEHA